jgi:hypothetical protein
MCPAMALGAVGGTLMGSYAMHRRSSLLASLAGVILPAVVGTAQFRRVDRALGEPPPADYAVAYVAVILIPVGAVVGNALGGR